MSLALLPEKPSARTISGVKKEREDHRINLEKLEARRAAVTAERDAIRKSTGSQPNPHDRFRLEDLNDEILSVSKEIERGNRRAEALTHELRSMELPGLRAEADRLTKEANREIERVFREPIRKLRAQLFENSAAATSVAALIDRANEAHWRAEQAAGEIAGVSGPADFDPRTAVVLRSLHAFGAADPYSASDPCGSDFSSRLTGPVPIGTERSYNFMR